VNLEALRSSLIDHEGWRNTMYRDHLGNWTVGVGHLMDRPLSDAAIDQILRDDIDTCIAEMDRQFDGWRDHDDVRQNVLIELCFNLGAPRLAKFRKMWAALALRRYSEAADEMLNSRWCVQVGRRAETLAERMRSGA